MNIIITGASSGVGFEAVIELLVTGKHKVIALARTQEKLEKLAEISLGLNPEAVVYPIVFDIVHDDYTDLQQFINSNFDGKVDVLINNAGALINKPFVDLSESDVVEMLQSNYLGHVRIIQSLHQFMPAGSHILN